MIVYTPPVLAAGVPLSVAVPFPLPTNVTPDGSAPVSLSVGVGTPVVVTLNVPAAPTVNVALLPLVIAGGLSTVIVNAVAAEDCPKVSLRVSVIEIVVCVVGVPDTTPVLELSDSPSAGRPVALQVSVPLPVPANVNEYGLPTVAGFAVNCACVVAIAGAGGLLTVMANGVAVEDCPNVSLTVTMMLMEAFDVGVPARTPAALSDSPSAGRPVALHVSVPVPVAWNVKPA